MSELILTEQATADTPSVGKRTVYLKPDGNLYVKDSTGAEAPLGAGGGGGVTDHGVLTGLTDDDHAQYLNNARGDARYDALGTSAAHSGNTSNPHSVTKVQVGLGNADNTSDVNKPVSTATQSALDAKQATLVSTINIRTINGASVLGSGDLVVAGTGGVTDHGALTGLGDDDHAQYHNDARGDARYAAIAHVGAGSTAHANVVASGAAGFMTGADKTKLDGVEASANNFTHPANHAPSIITQDASNRFVTDTEKATWDGKQATLVNQANIKSINGVSLLGSGDITVGGGGTPAWADITGKPTTLTGYGITDAEPIITKTIGYAKWTGSAWSFVDETYMQTSHAANGIAGSDIADWNTAFGWGNHALAGYTSNLGTVTSVGALTIGTAGSDVGSTVLDGETTPVITLNIPTASATKRGALSSDDWSAFNGKQAALGFTPEDVASKATDFITVNHTLYPTVQAVKAYADGLVAGLLDDRGNHSASGNTWPTAGGSGTAGAIMKGDFWYISVAGTLGGVAVNIGDSIRALVDTPGTTAANWSVLEGNLGFTPENAANKATSFSTVNNTLFPTVQAVKNYAGGLVADLSFGKPLRVGFAGDSIGGMWSASDGLSPLWAAAVELYPCDFSVVMNTSVGGTSSTHLLSVQIAQLTAMSPVPEVVFVQTLQNDFIGTAAGAVSFAANVTSYATQALAAGVQLVCICSRPPKSAADVPLAVVYCNRILEDYCRDTPGAYFVDVFSVWRYMNPAGETTIPFRGTANTANAYSDDGTHPTGLAIRAAAPLVVPILQRFARPIYPQPQAGVDYDDANYPWCNVLGRNGMMLGTNGYLNGVANAGVAGFAATTYARWYLTDNNGVTATPTLVTGADGYTYQAITLGGTATAFATVNLTFNFVQNVAAGTHFAEAIVDCASVVGVSQIQFAPQGLVGVAIGYGTTNQHTFNGRLHFRTAPAAYSNSGFGNKANTISIKIPNGVSPTGVVKIGRVGIYKVA